MPVTETYCTECEHTPADETAYCPECGAEDPWDDRPMYQFDEDDFPYVFSYEVYNDNYGLWRAFCQQYWGNPELTGGDVENLPDGFPKLKYNVFEVHYAITEDYDLEGPFLDKQDARTAVQ